MWTKNAYTSSSVVVGSVGRPFPMSTTTVNPLALAGGVSAAPWWREPRARPLAAVGILLVATGLAHVAVWGVLGGPWEGPVTWRKPILFGISGGLTGLSLGWAWSTLPWRREDGWLASVTAWSLLVEVLLIDLQCWRGVASHFNRSTTLDAGLYDAMGALILVVSLVAADLTIRVFRGPTTLEPDMHAAALAGLVLLVVSCGLGIWVSVHGDLAAARGREPEVYGAAGVPKFPHGAAIHALQWLPALAWAARRAGIPPARRRSLVVAASIGSGLVLVYALVQTLSGRARFDVTPVTGTLVGLGMALVGLPWPFVGLAWIRRLRRGDTATVPGNSVPAVEPAAGHW